MIFLQLEQQTIKEKQKIWFFISLNIKAKRVSVNSGRKKKGGKTGKSPHQTLKIKCLLRRTVYDKKKKECIITDRLSLSYGHCTTTFSAFHNIINMFRRNNCPLQYVPDSRLAQISRDDRKTKKQLLKYHRIFIR